jgi:nitric oxide reductase NorD protein
MEIDEKVGQWWHQYVTKKASRLFTTQAVFFNDHAKALKLFFHLLGGEKGKELHIADKRSIKTSRTLMERFSGTGKSFYLAWQDEKGIYLPASLSYFPHKQHNEMHYYWLVALLANGRVSLDTLQEDNEKLTHLLLDKYLGFHAFYHDVHAFLCQNYPELSWLNADDATLSQHNYPNPLWIYPAHGDPKQRLSDDDDEVAQRQRESDKTDTLQMKKKAEQRDDRKKTDGMLLFLPESIMSFMEQVNVDRQENDSFDDNALYDAQELDEITLGRKDANLNARLKMDLDITAHSVEYYPIGNGHFLDEWDYQKEQYLTRYVRLLPTIALYVEPIALPARLKKTMQKIQSELDLMALDRLKINNLIYGDEINLDAWIDYQGHENVSNHPQQFFTRFERKTRDLSTLILADISLSTEAGITQEVRVIDMVQDALMIFSESLHRLKDAFAIYAFSSIKNSKVHFHLIKNFKEPYSDLVRGRIHAIKPGYYTRMGAAIRESATILARQKTNNKLLIIISDGKPNDVDRYDGRYGIEDTKKAIEEVKKKGIVPFCITIDVDAKDYLPYLFGKDSFAVIRDAKKLPTLLPQIYMRLTH